MVAAFLMTVGPAAAANTTTFEVDSTGDQGRRTGVELCETESGTCTLRAAIQAANEGSGRDVIDFDQTLFDGEAGATIEAASPLPPITGPLTIDDVCTSTGEPTYVADRPCAGLDAHGLGYGFRVESDEVTIEGVAVTGASVGIEVTHSGDEFAARRDTLGATVEGTAAPDATGVLLGPGSNEAQIGTATAFGSAGGDTFVNDTDAGLVLEGASDAVIRGNRFGGTSEPNGKDIEIGDASSGGHAVKASEDEIGAKKSSFAEASTGCVENCNVISGAISDGIDLEGDGGSALPASGPILIRGNVIGASSSGVAAEPDQGVGVAVGSASAVTIGGPDAAGEGNQFVGGRWAVTAGHEETELLIEGNSVGLSAGEYPAPLGPPSEGAISLATLNRASVESVPEVVDNNIQMAGGIGVLDSGLGAEIEGNSIFGSDTGVLVDGERMWKGAWIEGNRIELPTEYGVVLDNWDNRVTGNRIVGAGKAGILADSAGWTGGTEDIIGGETEGLYPDWTEQQLEQEALEHEEEENEIDESEGPAIDIVGQNTRFVYALRNFGIGNAGPFVDLGGDGIGNAVDGPDEGAQPPTIISATPEEVSGDGARPGGTRVLVFLKSNSSPGEVEEFLNSTFAKEDGSWSVELPEALPVGTSIAVEQVFYGGSSELALGTVGPGPSKPSSPGSGGESKGDETPQGESRGVVATPSTHTPRTPTASRPTPRQTAPAATPDTRILAGPTKVSAEGSAHFRFAASVPGAKFECSLDGSPFRPCSSPDVYVDLRPGRHVFRVRAVLAGGGPDATPAKRDFRVVGPGRRSR